MARTQLTHVARDPGTKRKPAPDDRDFDGHLDDADLDHDVDDGFAADAADDVDAEGTAASPTSPLPRADVPRRWPWSSPRAFVATLGLLLTMLTPSSSGAAPETDKGQRSRDEALAQLKKEEELQQKKEAQRRAKEEALARAKEKALARAKEKALLKAKARERTTGKKDDEKSSVTTDMTRVPLLITYDPTVIGVGGSCPGDNEISRGECALIARDLRSARSHFLDGWNTIRSPFAAMRLGDLAWLEGELPTALQWYEQVNGATMMQRMANLRRCELEPGCGVTGRNVPSAETFIGPFGDEALLRTARIYARSGFPDLAASILVDGDGRGCDLGIETCAQIAALALAKETTTSTLALSLATRRGDDGQDDARAIAARQLGLDALAEDLAVTARGDVPEHRVTPREQAAAEARIAREARRAAARAEAVARKAAEAAAGKGDGDKPADGDKGDKPADGDKGDKPVDGDKGDKPVDGDKGDKPAEASKPQSPAAEEAAAREAAVKELAARRAAREEAIAKEAAARAAADGVAPDATKKPVDVAAEKKAAKKKALDKKTKRDLIDRGVKDAEESIEKTRRLLEVAGGGLPLGGPK
jgi:hypothetical protein